MFNWEEVVGLKSSNYTYKITIFVQLLNLGNFVKILIFLLITA